MLPYGRQTIDEDDIAAVVDALRAPLLTCGPLVARFEAALAERVTAPFASVCANGTSALHLAYAALGIGEGDEVITTPITFSSTAQAAYYVGAKVRFADVDPATGNLDPKSVESLITSRTRAIVPVHLGGMPVDLADILDIAKRRGLRVIEDACHALGASYRGTPIGGGDSDAVVFSFHPVKHITTGEGGAVMTRTQEMKRRVDRLRQHGIVRQPGAWSYEVAELGWNYRLSDLSCALGLSQLAKLDHFIARRSTFVDQYRYELAHIPGLDVPVVKDDRSSAYHLCAISVDWDHFGTTRQRVMDELAAAGIATQVHYIPLLDHPLHAARNPGQTTGPNAARYFHRTLTLPLFPAMTADDVSRVAGEVRRVLGVAQ